MVAAPMMPSVGGAWERRHSTPLLLWRRSHVTDGPGRPYDHSLAPRRRSLLGGICGAHLSAPLSQGSPLFLKGTPGVSGAPGGGQSGSARGRAAAKFQKTLARPSSRAASGYQVLPLPAASAFLNGSLTQICSPGSRPGSGVLANSSAEERAGDLSALGAPRSFR